MELFGAGGNPTLLIIDVFSFHGGSSDYSATMKGVTHGNKIYHSECRDLSLSSVHHLTHTRAHCASVGN